MKRTFLISAVCLLASLPMARLAGADPLPIADEAFSGTTLGFAPIENFHNVVVTVAGPNDFKAREFSPNGVPPVELTDFGTVNDGPYNYEITAATEATTTADNSLDNGRGNQASTVINVGAIQSGGFVVEGGAIVSADVPPESE